MRFTRRELPSDRAVIFEINRLAFGRDGEAKLVDLLRDSTPPAQFISIVVEENNAPIAHALYSPISIAGVPAIALAPVAVHPAHQRTGAGTAAIQAGLAACRAAGQGIVVVVGHPEYYPRFGFEPARAKGLEAPFPVSDDAFLVLALRPGALERVGGLVTYPPPFLDPSIV